MTNPSRPLSKDELLRLAALEEYEVSDAAPDAALEEITALAADLCGTPMAAISLIGADHVLYLARVGPGPGRLTRGRLPCELCSRQDDLLEIQDARYHPDFRPDGIMIAGRAYRFYAGAPLKTPAGVRIGCLFTQDFAPHILTDKQKRGMVTLSHQVIYRLELMARTRLMDQDARVRARVEAALTVERNFVSTVLDTVAALVAVFDTAGRIVRFNRACEEASGYEFSTQVGRYLWDELIPKKDVTEAVQAFERLRGGRFPAAFENYWQHRDGSLRRIAWSATALVDPQGQTTFIIATGIDVTVQREAESTLRESEARYRQLVEGSLGMVCTHNMDGMLLSVNQHSANSLGYRVDEMVGQNLRSFMPEEVVEDFSRYLLAIRRSGESLGRMHVCHRDGDVRVVVYRNKLIDVAGREPYVLGFGVDISEQVRAEEKLRALINQSNSILESVGDGIFGIDLQGRATVVNPAAAQMLGYRPNELLGRKLHELIMHTRADGTAYREADSPMLGKLLQSTPAAGGALDAATVRMPDEIFWRKDGSSFPVEYVARPQFDNVEGNRAGKPIGVVVAFSDTTERRALDRMKDEFISTVSHELRTPLTSMRAALGLVTGGALATRPDKMQHMLDIAVGNTDRLIKLVNDILDIERIGSGNADLHSAMVSAHALLERAVGLQQAAALKANVRVVVRPGSVLVYADPDRISQALTNLISNAIKFSFAGGEVVLSARRVDEHEAQIDVEDQGRGIPEDKLDVIFERFQQVDASDSRAMGGTGLGLAICRSIITQHGGRIWVSSSPGAGAAFHFTLPTHPSGHLR